MSDAEKRKLSQARVADLRAELEKRGLDKNGVKAVLVERLVSALAVDGLSSGEIDDYVVESASDIPKKQAKRGVTPSKTKEEDEMMADLDNKSEVLDYGENDDLENTKEDETMDTVEPETIKKVAEKEPNKIKGNEDVIEEDVFQVLDEEASDIEDSENKDGQQQDGNVDNEDSIHLTLNEDDEKLLIEEDENGFSTESDAPAARGSRTQLRKNQSQQQQYKHSAGGSSGATKKQSPSKEDDKADKHQESGAGSGDASGATSSEKKKSSSPKGTSRSSVDEKHSSVSSTQQQSDTQQEGLNGDKSRSGASPKESKDKASDGNDNKRDSSPNSANSSGRNLWVSGLSSTTRATDLKQNFSKYGKVLGAKVVTNARTPGARCYGFVTMSKKEDAARCIQHLDRTELHGRMISVEKAKGEATGPGRVKTPTSPGGGKEDKQAEGDKDSQKKESSSSKSGDSSRDQRREGRDKGGKPIRQRITAPSPGPTSDRSDSRTEPRTSAEPLHKKRQRTRTPPPRHVPPRRVNHSPGGGLHTRRSASAVLTFASIKQARERQRLREREREDREHARRREEEARRLERRQREEQLRIEREKEELRLERERIEKARKDILRLEREKAKLERERLEWEREELRRQQQKLRELAERPPPLAAPLSAVPSRSWNTSSGYMGGRQTSIDSRYDDVRRGGSSATGTKRHSDHHSSEYFDERAPKRPVPSSSDDRPRAYESAPTVPPPPRFSSSSSSSTKRPADNRRDMDFTHRSSSSSNPFERTSTGGPVSTSSSYDRPSTAVRREGYFPGSSSSTGGRVVEPTQRVPETARRVKDERYRDSYRPSVRGNERPMGGRDVPSLDSRSGALPSDSSISGAAASARQRRYPAPVGRTIASSNAPSREPWIDRKSDNSGSSWPRTTETTSSDRWPTNNISMSNSRGSGIYNTSVTSLGLGIGSMGGGGPPTNTIFGGSGDRYDAYKNPLSALRKY